MMMLALGIVLGCGLGAVATIILAVVAEEVDRAWPTPPTSWELRKGPS